MNNQPHAGETGTFPNPEKGTGHTRYFVRMNDSERRQHFLFVICFAVLTLTGLMIWLPDNLFKFLGSAKETIFIVRSWLHRVFGTIMIIVSMYHVLYLVITRPGRRFIWDMAPRPGDIKDLIHNLLYFIEVKDHPPEFDRFSYKQKMEYGALIAGTILMSVSGLIMWSEFFWDKFIIDIATLIHGMEAVLACLAIMIWHLYEVHLRPHKFPIDNVWLTGIIDEHEMKEEYALHYKKIMQDPELQKIYIKEG